jgi:hypothetical protein
MSTIHPSRAFLLAALMAGTAWSGAEGQSKASTSLDRTSLLMERQADSIKTRFTLAGYKVLEETRVTMKSESDLPVIVNMKQGEWYQVVFIGDTHSRSCEVRMYDYDENEVVYKKNDWAQDGNIITYPFVPRLSEFHLIKPVQHTQSRKKNLYGYFMLMQKTENRETVAAE